MNTSSSVPPPPMQASKWVYRSLLIDEEEMVELLKIISPLEIFIVSRILGPQEGKVWEADFLNLYAQYIRLLKKGELPLPATFRDYFSAAFSWDLKSFYQFKIDEKRYLLKPILPVVQLQAHRFYYSVKEGTLRSMIYGQDTIEWGITFGLPQLFQDPKLGIIPVKEGEKFPNAMLFRKLKEWMIEHTLPTPFILPNQKRMNASFRLGKRCFSWINNHPQLAKAGLVIERASS